MSKIISFVCATLVAMVSFSLFAADPITYYANAAQPDDSGDGLTPQTAKRHIQAAVDLAASGDTVSVAEGVYNEGDVLCKFDDDKSARRVARVVITNKVNLVASGAREKTIIDGAGSVCGVNIYYESWSGSGNQVWTKSKGTVVRGFTIANCKRTSGSFLGVGVTMSESYLVDCVVSNCYSNYRGAGTYSGVAIRCLYADNYSTTYGSAMMQTTCMNCIIIGQRGKSTLGCYGSAFYNCTVVGNNISGYSTMGSSPFYNTIYVGNSSQSIFGAAMVCNKCILSPNSTNYDTENSTVKTDVPDYCFAAPMLGDWRPTRALGAAEFGDASYLANVTLPAALEEDRYLDFYGRPIPQTGAITCGAVQEICEAEGSLVTFDEPCEVEGIPLIVTNASMSAFNKYYWSDDYPGMIKFRALGVPLEKVVWYNLTTNAGTSRVAQLVPTMDNWAGHVPYPGQTNHLSVLTPNTILYVDAANGSDDNDGKTRDAALASINAAILKLPKGKGSAYTKSTIVVAPGVYTNSADSTAASYVVNHYNQTPGGNKDWVYRYTRIVAEEGPEKTIIDGCGRTRCVQAAIGLLLQGFTLTGATGTDNGTAFNSSSQSNGTVADCIISNNYVYSEKKKDIDASIVRRALVVRCKFADNRVNAYAGGVVIDSDIMNSEFVESVPKAHESSYVIASGSKVFFSVAKGSCHGRVPYYYSIVPGGLVVENKEGRAYYCYANGTKPIKVDDAQAIVENCFYGKAGCISWNNGDFRLRPGADALGKATINPAVYAPYAQLDLDGNPLKRDVLTGNTIGSHQLAEAGWTPPGLILMFW